MWGFASIYVACVWFFYQRMEIFIFFPEMSTEQWDLWCSIFHTQIILNKLIPVLPRTLNQCLSKTVESILEVQDFSGFVLSFLLLVTNKNLNIPLFHFAFNSVWDRLTQDLKITVSRTLVNRMHHKTFK